MKKNISMWLTVFGVSLFSMVFIFTGQVEANGIVSSISSDSQQLKSSVDTAAGGAVALLRYFAVAVAVVLFVWMMFSLFFQNDSNSLFEMKKRLGGFVVALVCVFFAEAILGTLMGLFNIDLPSFIMFLL